MFKRLKDRLFLIKVKDVASILLLPIACVAVPFVKKRGKKIWVICERSTEARDNGICFFEYMMEKHPEVHCYYAIDPKSNDFNRANKYSKNVIRFGSFKHIVLFLLCDANVSSVKNSGPNDLIGFIFRELNLMTKKNIFLQHGTIINNCDWLHYPDTKFRLFCCGSVPEYEYVSKNYEYPEGYVVNNGGQCRFDLLSETRNEKENIVLVMPSWRRWLKFNNLHMMDIEGTRNFTETLYYKRWTEFIGSKRLASILERNNMKLVFYPHPTMQRYIDDFASENKRVIIGDFRKSDLQRTIREACMLITDYSSILFDFVYMGKPIVFYQFDKDVFEKYHYSAGYFSYSDNPVAKSFSNLTDLENYIEKNADNGFDIDDEYRKYRDYCFPLRDNNNCMRVYENIRRVIT